MTFRLYKTDITLHWTILIPLVLLSISMGWMAIPFWVFLYSSILLHEFGHIAATRKFGYRCDKIILMVFGGVAVSNQRIRNYKQRMLVYIAGPAVSLLIALLCLYPAIWCFSHEDYFGPYDSLIHNILLTNWILFVFNLIPIYPMDGGGILHCVNLMRKCNEIEACKSTARTSFVIIGLVAIWAIIQMAFMLVIVMILAAMMNKRLYDYGEQGHP